MDNSLVTFSHYDDDTILGTVETEIISADNAGRFRKNVEVALLDYNNIVLSLKKLKLIDSTGLGCLISFHWACTSRGGSLTVRDVPQAVMNLLRLTLLDQHLRIESLAS